MHDALPQRVIDKIVGEPNSGCWLWTAGLVDGYGRMQHPETKKLVLAHRYVYEKLVGKIPEGLQIDHLCRVRCCVNPRHLEPVTPYENFSRGLRAPRTVCCHGHQKPLGEGCPECRRIAGLRGSERYRRKNGARVRSKTHCYKGHLMKDTPWGRKVCPECRRTRFKALYWKKKNAVER